MRGRKVLGKPCKRGHGGLRYWSNLGCVECQKLQSARQWVNMRSR